MPHLDTVKLAIPSALPQQLVDYSSLRHLDITCYDRTLPTWMSQLTQLDTLRVDAAAAADRRCSEFPVCLLQLKQLSSLDLYHILLVGNDLLEEIAHFSNFVALTDLCMCQVQPNSGAHQQLTSLESLLGLGVLHWPMDV